jgi:hypothetical protein
MSPFISCLFAIAVVIQVVPAADGFVWVEGEAATTKTVVPHGWYSDAVKKDQLSGNAWISHFTDKSDGLATYDLTIPADGDYTLWVRANVIGSALSYQVDGGAWKAIDTGKGVDVVNIASDGKPDLRIIGWLNGGVVTLKAGTVKVGFKMHSGNNHHGGIDCFVLTKKSFTPNGAMKPGQKLGLADAGWWAFEPDADEFRADALLDLRHLNEKVAGESGFIKAAGDLLRLGNGKPVRFWAINSGHGLSDADDALIELTAKRWAKGGINLVRLHGALFDRKGNDPTVIDRHQLERFHRTVRILKRHGIYTKLSHFFPLWMQLKASDGIAGAALGKHPFCLPYFEPRMQEIYRAWLKQLLTTKVDGTALIDEPALAMVEIINEDSLFFWTFTAENLGQGPLATLEGQFADYLSKKYGDLDQAFAAWGGAKQARDNITGKRATLLDAWNMTRDGMKDKRARMTDQIAFLATTQRGFYADMNAYMKGLGLKAPVSASNWTTADNLVLGGIERWTYLATDVVDKHGYFGGKHEGDHSAGYSVREGHRYEDKSALLDPESVPISYVQHAGRPHLHSEIAWNKPNRFIADGNLLVASYAALQGVDGYIWFAAADGNWLNNGNGKWTWMMPGEFGQSYAAALQYRRGDVQESAPVIRQVLSDADILALKHTGIVEGRNVDFRIGEAPKASDAGNLATVDPLATFAGRVERSFDATAKPEAMDLSKLIDRTAKKVTSTTGELTWRFGDGLMTVNTPKSQAVTGFLSKAGTVQLGDITITSGMEYGTIHVISLDDQPLATSKKILIQAFSEEKMYGFKAEGGVIKDAGRVPINVRDIQGTVTFTKGGGMKAVVLDANGYAKGKAEPVAGGAVRLVTDALYMVVTR